jgi:hypothetical protein
MESKLKERNGRSLFQLWPNNRIITSSKGLDAKTLSAELNTVKFSMWNSCWNDILAVYDACNFPLYRIKSLRQKCNFR